MTQQYSLRWNNHQPNFISMFTSLLNSQSLVDVTLAAEGRHLLAHKVVLSACSTYFQSLFIDNPSRHPIVILKDVTYAHLRIMVDFMYSGEVNVAADQLEKVLHTAKTLKIKGLTEMPDTTSVMRSQSAEYLQPQEPESRPPISPATSPASKRRRRRKSSTGSGNLNVGHHEERLDGGQSMEQIRESITLSSLPQLRRSGTLEDPLQQSHSSNMHMETVSLDTGASTSLQEYNNPGVKYRRANYFKRQSHVSGERELLTQSSEPGPTMLMLPAPPPQPLQPQPLQPMQPLQLQPMQPQPLQQQPLQPQPQPLQPQPMHLPHPMSMPLPMPVLQKYQSYPQYSKTRRSRALEQQMGSLMIRAVTVVDRQAGNARTRSTTSSSTSTVTMMSECQGRSSHTPAVRTGPPLSCNFCWNTLDECGRIQRRKTQYHCPECRTNLCIVPCFHQYHEAVAVMQQPTEAR